jgi:3-methyl-2-oxobutanoate hydroxymethyltransferase
MVAKMTNHLDLQIAKVSAPMVLAKKSREKIVMLTAYDFPMARLLDTHVDMILVGDTLGCVVQGHPTTLPVTLDEIIYHARMVSRAVQHALVVGDLPFGSYQLDARQGLRSALRLLKEANVGAVKLEGGQRSAETIAKIVTAGIPTLAHIGLTPQSVHAFGGNKVQGKQTQQAKQLLADAKAVADAGAFALILEAIPSPLAQQITQAIAIPTIGIGAGNYCDGQVLVINDMIGLNTSPAPMKFNKEYCAVREMISKAAKQFTHDVRSGAFPDAEHSYGLTSVC